MKWPVYIHSRSSTVGKNLKTEHVLIFQYLKKEIHRYLTAYSLREELLKDIIKSWNQINAETFLPILFQITKLIRYRLIDANAIAYHRLVHLCNALIRNCGTTAHALLGREKFLRTILYSMKIHSKSKQILSNESAALLYRFLKEWTEGLNERRDLFPYYQDAWHKAERTLPELARYEVEHMVLTIVEQVPVQVAEEYRTPTTNTTPVVTDSNRVRAESRANSLRSEPQQQQQQERVLSIQVDDLESLHLNRVSSLHDTNTNSPLSNNTTSHTTPSNRPSSVTTTSSTNSPQRSSPKPVFVPQYEKAASKLQIIVEETPKKKPAVEEVEDDSTVNLDHYYEDIDRLSATKQRLSVNTTTSTNTNTTNSTANHTVAVYPQKQKVASPSFEEKMEVTYKYYGTQRVVSYKKSQKNVLASPTASQQAILQQ